MRDAIKAEDVPDELVRHYLSSVVGDSWKHKIAADINAAIDAGLVSPPVYCTRWQGVMEMEDGLPIVRIDAPDLSPQKLVSYEHYRGQKS